MSPRGAVVIEGKENIQNVGYLQIYYKLKLEVDHPGGPTWKQSPNKIARAILAQHGIKVSSRRKSATFEAYKEWLETRLGRELN